MWPVLYSLIDGVCEILTRQCQENGGQEVKLLKDEILYHLLSRPLNNHFWQLGNGAVTGCCKGERISQGQAQGMAVLSNYAYLIYRA